MITLFGATGYTGTLIATALEKEGLQLRLAGRSVEKLSALSQALASHPGWITADVGQPSSLPALFKDANLLINCAGPFTDLGERLVSMAAVSGVHYLDTTNELGFVYRVHKTYQPLAQKSKAAVVPACAFEVAIADCAAAHLARSFPGPYQSLDTVYRLSGNGASRGTRLSALRSLATSWIAYRDGRWVGEAPGSNRRWFQLYSGRYPATTIPSSETVTIPGHLQIRRVTTWMTGGKVSTFFAPLLLPFFARFLRGAPGRAVLWAAGLGGSAPAIRANDPFEVMVQLRGSERTASTSVCGIGPYELTAKIITSAARQILSPAFNLCGVISPSGLFAHTNFNTIAADWGLTLN